MQLMHVIIARVAIGDNDYNIMYISIGKYKLNGDFNWKLYMTFVWSALSSISNLNILFIVVLTKL